VATSVTTTAANSRLIGIFAITDATTVTPPGGMTDEGEAASHVSGQPKVTIEPADTTQTATGATGTRTATAAAADLTNAHLIAVKPASTGNTTRTFGYDGAARLTSTNDNG